MTNQKKNTILNILIGIFALVFIVSTSIFLFNLYQGKKETADLEAISKEQAEVISNKVESDEESENEMSYEEALIYANNQLHQKNDEMYGWLKISNTIIDYPVMYTPDNFQKYLRKDFKGDYSLAGLPFLGDGNSIDYPEFNTIIYSHNMNNGTMFHDLLKYENQEFLEENPTIQFSTLNEIREYEVVAAFRIDIEEDPFVYYDYVEWDDEYNQNFINEIKQRSLYNIDMDVDVSDQLLTLSTCDYYSPEGRFVVVAKRIGEYENLVNPNQIEKEEKSSVIDEKQ